MTIERTTNKANKQQNGEKMHDKTLFSPNKLSEDLVNVKFRPLTSTYN